MKILKFYADWCGPCKMITPFIRELASKHEAELLEIDVDADQNKNMIAKYSISSIPKVVFITDKGEQEVVGANPQHVYQEAIEKII